MGRQPPGDRRRGQSGGQSALSIPTALVKTGAVTEIINLRQARKQKQRAGKDQQAAENRAKFGRTKVEKQREAADTARVRRTLDQSKLTGDRDE